MINSLSSITGITPENIWTLFLLIITNAFTLLGIYLANRHSNKQQKMRFEHESDENHKSRIDSVRYDIYMNAVEELTKSTQYLSTLPNIDPTQENVSAGVNSVLVAFSKINIIANDKTAQAANEFISAYGVLSLRMMGEASELHEIKTNINVLDFHYKNYTNEVNRILAEIQNFNEKVELDPSRFDALQNSLRFNQQQATKYNAEILSLWRKFNNKNYEFYFKLQKELESINVLQSEVLKTVREEIGLGFNVNLYLEAANKHKESLELELKVLADRLNIDETREG